MSDSSVLIRCSSCKTLNRVPSEKLKSRPVCGQCRTPLEFPLAPIDATEATFEREIFDWPEFVLVEFWAKWCGFCRMVEPVVSNLASWNAGRLKVIRVDVDAEPGLARRFMVKATPTFVVYKNGTQIARMDGAPKEKFELVQWIDQILKH